MWRTLDWALAFAVLPILLWMLAGRAAKGKRGRRLEHVLVGAAAFIVPGVITALQATAVLPYSPGLAVAGLAAAAMVVIRLLVEQQRRVENYGQRARIVTEFTEPVFLQDDDGHILDMNPAAVRLVDAVQLEPSRLETTLLQLQKDEQALGSLTFSVEGSERAYRSHRMPIRLSEPTRVGQIVVLYDQTEVQAMARRHATAKREFRELVDNLPLGIYRSSVGDGDHIVMANPAALQLFGFATAAEMSRAPVAKLYVDPAARAGLLARLATEDKCSYVAELARTDGTTFWGQVNVHSVRDESGAVRYLDGVVQDVSEAHAAHAALENARALAEEANRAKSDFLANMSHEIRTPMNGIVGMADLLADSGLEAEQRQCVDTITSCAEHLLRVLSDILDFSKIEAGKVEVERVPFDLHETVTQSGDLFAANAKARGIDLLIDVGTKQREVVGDSVRLRQVLANLLSNAIKFTEEGRVELMVTDTTDGKVLFRVRDTGVGFDAAAAERIFASFVQADSSTTRRYGGTGLGLAISRQLVELMGGELRAVGEPGSGAEFSFALPLKAPVVLPTLGRLPEQRLPAPPRAGELRQDHDGPTRGAAAIGRGTSAPQDRRVLVVEDNPVNQMVARKLLQRMGYQVTIACNGREGLDLLGRELFDLVLMDVHMPVMDGLEAVRRIRAGETLDPDVAVVALTARAQEQDRLECLEAGMTSFLTKPVRRPELEQVMFLYLPQRRGSAA
jgi:PAS domain S-box-containing protein